LTGVCVPQRGHAIVLLEGAGFAGAGCGAARGPGIGIGIGGPGIGIAPGIGGPDIGIAPGIGGPGIGPGGIGPMLGGAIIGAPPIGAIIGAPNGDGAAGGMLASPLPQLRQNFMPGGFSPRHEGQIVGNPEAEGGVCPYAGGGVDNELPQLRQNDDPAGLSWPHIEQRIVTFTLSSHPGVSQHATVSGMGSGLFARAVVPARPNC
jgi:hypothetical protein